MNQPRLTVACNGNRYRLHPADLAKVSKLIKYRTPVLPHYQEDYGMVKFNDPDFVSTFSSTLDATVEGETHKQQDENNFMVGE